MSVKRSHAVLLAVGLCSIACSARTAPRLVQIPEAVDRIAVLLIDAEGALIHATGLGPVPADRLLVVIPDSEVLPRAMLFGYQGSELAAHGAPEDPALSDTPLRLAVAGDPRLPVPAVSWSLNLGDGSEPKPLGPPPALTVDWLGRCSVGSVEASLDCAIEACQLNVQANGCQVTVDGGEGCGPFTFELNSDRQASDGSSTAFASCQPVPPPSGAFAGLRCSGSSGSCSVDLSVADQPAAFSLRTVTVEGAGAISSAVAIGAEAIVAGIQLGQSCELGSRFYRIDLSGARAISAVPAPACLDRLVALGAGRGFSGIFGVHSRDLGFFADDGALTASVALPGLVVARRTARSERVVYVLGMTTLDDPGRGAPHRLYAVDIESRRLLSTADLGSLAEFTGLAVAPDRVVLVNDVEDNARSFDPLSLLEDPTQKVDLRLAAGLMGTLNLDLSYHPSSQRFLSLTGARFAGISVFGFTGTPPEPTLFGRAVTFGPVRHQPRAAVVWPPDPRYLMVGLEPNSGSEVPTRFALLDPLGRRFLPGVLAGSARSTIDLLVPSDQGAIGLHPGSGELSILSPR